MGRYEWLDKLDAEEYIMPFVIEKDKEYKNLYKQNWRIRYRCILEKLH